MPKKKATTKEAPKPQIEQIAIHEPRRFFCDKAYIPFNEEHFLLALQTGSVVAGEFVFTPKHMKRFLERLQKQIAEYEKQFGEIKASLSDIK